MILRCAPNAQYIARIDDNAVLDLDRLVRTLHYSDNLGINTDMDILCSFPFRNQRPIIYRKWAGYDTVSGKWSYKLKEFSEKYLPDYCVGWVYVLTPKLAGAMAQVASNMAGNELKANVISDYFINGLIRRKIVNSRVMPFIPNSYKTETLLQCPFLASLANVFFNDIVLEKNDYINGWKFVLRFLLEEFIINPIQFLISDLVSENSSVAYYLKYTVMR